MTDPPTNDTTHSAELARAALVDAAERCYYLPGGPADCDIGDSPLGYGFELAGEGPARDQPTQHRLEVMR